MEEIIQAELVGELVGQDLTEQPAEQIVEQGLTVSSDDISLNGEVQRAKSLSSDQMSLAVLTFDEHDALLIEQSLKGVVSNKFVYEFKARDGSEVKGLSVIGVRAAVHYLNAQKSAGIRINDDLKVEFHNLAGETWVIATVSASDNFSNRWYGAAQQPLHMTRKDGSVTIDPFAVAKAVSKAQRNALRGLFPEPIVVELIDLWTKEGKVQEFTEQDLIAKTDNQPTDLTLNQPSNTINVTVQETQTTKSQTEPPKPEPAKPIKVEVSDSKDLWRQVYRVAKDIYGIRFKDELRRIVKERYDIDRLELPPEALSDLLTYLEAEKRALQF